MAKQTKQETSPVPTGEVNTESTPLQEDLNTQVDTDRKTEEERKAKEEREAEEERKAKEEREAEEERKAKEEREAEEERKAKEEREAEEERKAIKQTEIKTNERLLTGYDYKGRKYNFTAGMPNKINIDGQIVSKEEIMSNPDIIESMIDSNNIFIKIV